MFLLFCVAAVITGFVALSLFFFQATRKTYPGFGYWTTGVGLLALGYLLYALRGQIPLWTTVFLGNYAFSLGMVLHLDGIRRFLGLKPASLLWYALPVAVMVGVAVFYFRWDSPTWRGLVGAIPLTVIHWTMAALLFRCSNSPRLAFYKVIISLLSIAGCLILVRAVWLILSPNSDLLFKASLEFAFFTSFIVLHLGENLCLFMLNAERMEGELLESKDNLAQTVIDLEKALFRQKETEESLRDSEDRYRTFFDTSRDAVFMTTLDGRFIDFNDVALETFGYDKDKREEVLRKKVSDFYANPHERETHADVVAKVGFLKEYPVDLRRPDGTIIHTLITTVARKNVQGNIIGFQGTLRDITQSKRALEALATSRSELHAIYDSSPIMMCVLDVERRVLYANRALTEFFGKTEDELKSGPACGIFGCINALDDPRGCGYGPKCEFCTIKTSLEDTSQTGVIHRAIEYRATLVLAGRHKEVVLQGSTARIQSGDGSRVLLCLEDITERKAAEQETEELRNQILQVQKMEAIGTLTGGIAHDFNNLLTIINGYAEMLLLEKAKDDPIREDLEKIYRTGRKGADLVQRLLAFDKKAEISPRLVNLRNVVENSVGLMRSSFPKIIEIEMLFEEGLKPVEADESQVEQVLMNLCINSKESMPDGGRLRIESRNILLDEAYCRMHHGANAGPHVLLEISDTGKGMDKKTMARMYDPFFTTKGWDFKKGTGLGLSVAKGIVEQHGGWLTCDSEPGVGTTFRIYFPALESRLVSETGELPMENVSGGQGKILLIDDEEYIRELGKRLLERSGYSVITAADGKEALETYRRDRSSISLVILDLIMPHMTGQKCFDEMLKINPDVRVIVATGHSLAQDEWDRLSSRAKGIVTKPYQLELFLLAVDKALVEERTAEMI